MRTGRSTRTPRWQPFCAIIRVSHSNRARGTRYSNIGYWLLGKIVERASGETFTSYVTNHILQPPGAPREASWVTRSSTRPTTRPGTSRNTRSSISLKGFLIDRQLVGDYYGRWLEIRSHYLNGPAFGGLVGSARAFGAFLQDQLRPHSALFSDATRTLFCEPQQTAGGHPIAMTLGWHIGNLDGRRFLYKEGGGGGFHCMMRLYPDRSIGSVVMSNATGFDVAHLLNAVDRTFFIR